METPRNFGSVKASARIAVGVSFEPVNKMISRWLQPMPTSRLPRGGIRWRDKRHVSAQIQSGINIAAWIIGGFLVVGLAMGGLVQLHESRTARGLCELSAATIILLLTVHRWAAVMPGVFFVRGIAKGSILLIVGASSSYSQPPISRLELAELVLYSLAVVALTWRFLAMRPAMTTLWDRLALTFFVVAMLNQLTVHYSFPPVWMALGLLALAIAWIAHRWDRSNKLGKHHPGTPPSAATQLQID
jgi:heme A synthase